jgi:Uma2 family endonuclease
MSMPLKSEHITVEEYLKTEFESPTRREYVDGQVFAMTGATWSHNMISGNLFAALHAHLRGSGCSVAMSDMKVRIEAADCFYYPDVMVTCEPFVGSSVYNIAPAFIAEVLSPSTSQIDRREKLLAYKQIATLKEYMIVCQDRKRIELYQRDEGGHLVMSEYVGGDKLTLDSLPEPFTFEVDLVYEGTGTP